MKLTLFTNEAVISQLGDAVDDSAYPPCRQAGADDLKLTKREYPVLTCVDGSRRRVPRMFYDYADIAPLGVEVLELSDGGKRKSPTETSMTAASRWDSSSENHAAKYGR